MAHQAAFALSGGTPGADSSSYTLFDSQTAVGSPYGLINTEWQRLVFRLNNSHSGTVKLYGVLYGTNSYVQVDSDAWTAPASGEINTYDADIAGFSAVKLVWTNGGSAQTTWNGSVALIDDRQAGE